MVIGDFGQPYLLLVPEVGFFTATTETSQNSSKLSHYSTDHNECIDLCIKPL